jgi:hypothetical protein
MEFDAAMGHCLCGKWEVLGMDEASARHCQKMHARLEAQQRGKIQATATFPVLDDSLSYSPLNALIDRSPRHLPW